MEPRPSDALKSPASAAPVAIGWVEAAALPEWKVRRIRAKMDTGARTSALDVPHYHLVDTDQGTLVELHLALSRHQRTKVKRVRTPLLRMVMVQTSCGTRERRPVVETVLRLGSTCVTGPISESSTAMRTARYWFGAICSASTRTI